MTELIRECTIPSGCDGIGVFHNPPWAQGLQFTRHTRFFMVSGEDSPAGLYMVPALHFYNLGPIAVSGLVGIEVPFSMLALRHKRWLYRCQYGKGSGPYFVGGGAAAYDHWFSLAGNKKAGGDGLAQELMKELDTRLPGLQHQTPLANINLVDALMANLAQTELDRESCTVKAIAQRLHCTERTLHRACVAVLGIGLQRVLHYHLSIKAFFLLVHKGLKPADVACQLSFSGSKTLGRFLKRHAGIDTIGEGSSCLLPGWE